MIWGYHYFRKHPYTFSTAQNRHPNVLVSGRIASFICFETWNIQVWVPNHGSIPYMKHVVRPYLKRNTLHDSTRKSGVQLNIPQFCLNKYIYNPFSNCLRLHPCVSGPPIKTLIGIFYGLSRSFSPFMPKKTPRVLPSSDLELKPHNGLGPTVQAFGNGFSSNISHPGMTLGKSSSPVCQKWHIRGVVQDFRYQ